MGLSDLVVESHLETSSCPVSRHECLENQIQTKWIHSTILNHTSIIPLSMIHMERKQQFPNYIYSKKKHKELKKPQKFTPNNLPAWFMPVSAKTNTFSQLCWVGGFLKPSLFKGCSTLTSLSTINHHKNIWSTKASLSWGHPPAKSSKAWSHIQQVMPPMFTLDSEKFKDSIRGLPMILLSE